MTDQEYQDPIAYNAAKFWEFADEIKRLRSQLSQKDKQLEKMGKALDDIFMIPSVFGTFKETIVTKRIQEIARQALKDWKEKG